MRTTAAVSQSLLHDTGHSAPDTLDLDIKLQIASKGFGSGHHAVLDTCWSVRQVFVTERLSMAAHGWQTHEPFEARVVAREANKRK